MLVLESNTANKKMMRPFEGAKTSDSYKRSMESHYLLKSLRSRSYLD